MTKKIMVTKELLKTVYDSASIGLTNNQIADQLGVGRTWLYDKLSKHEELAATLKEGRAKGIGKITNALYESAMEGNTTSMIFFLKNRAEWRDKSEVEHKGEVRVKLGFKDFYKGKK